MIGYKRHHFTDEEVTKMLDKQIEQLTAERDHVVNTFKQTSIDRDNYMLKVEELTAEKKYLQESIDCYVKQLEEKIAERDKYKRILEEVRKYCITRVDYLNKNAQIPEDRYDFACDQVSYVLDEIDKMMAE